MRLVLLIFRNLRRSLLRTALTAMGCIVLVFVVTLVWSVLWFLDSVTAEKSRNFKSIVTERWQIPSQMPFAYSTTLTEGAARNPGDVKPDDSMTWQFYGGTLEQGKTTREGLVFAFALEPKKLMSMMDELEELQGKDREEFAQLVAKLESNRQGIIMGRERLSIINKRVGERIKLYGMNYRDIDLEFEIVGTFPLPRYDQSAAINRDYLNEALDNYPRTHKGQKHAMADRSLNLVWLRVPDVDSFERVADQIVSSPLYSQPAVKVETASSGISAFLEAYRDLIWGMRWLLAPAIIVTLALVIANAISISVRERRIEVAIMKVLGFRPLHILLLILGEALAIGATAGLASAAATVWIINGALGGLKFPIAFFPAFFIPTAAIWWGLMVGALTAAAGSIVPAWTASAIKVSEVFAKVD